MLKKLIKKINEEINYEWGVIATLFIFLLCAAFILHSLGYEEDLAFEDFQKSYEQYDAHSLSLSPHQLKDSTLASSMTAVVTDGENYLYREVEFTTKTSPYIIEIKIKNNGNSKYQGVNFKDGDIISYDMLEKKKEIMSLTLKNMVALNSRLSIVEKSGCYNKLDYEEIRDFHLNKHILNEDFLDYSYTYKWIYKGLYENVTPNYTCLVFLKY